MTMCFVAANSVLAGRYWLCLDLNPNKGGHSNVEVKLVKMSICPKWVAPVDPLTTDLSHCVSLTYKHKIIKRVNTYLYLST